MIDKLRRLRNRLFGAFSAVIDQLRQTERESGPSGSPAPLPRDEQEELQQQHEEVMQLAREVEEQAAEARELLDDIDLHPHHTKNEDCNR